MLIIPPPKRKKKAPAPPQGATRPPAVALTLASAAFDADAAVLNLAFDRAIDVAGIIASRFVIHDGPGFHAWTGNGEVTLTGPNAVQLRLVQTGDDSGPETLLDVGAGNGIVAVDDGGTWAGAAGLVLPWP
jgi:hypothetical protein